LKEEELPNILKHANGSQFVNEACPLVWNEFKYKLKYSTLLVEDWPTLGLFNYKYTGMSEPPVDHYLR
jgi:hypothetical protein